jgi:hypothetical protein
MFSLSLSPDLSIAVCLHSLTLYDKSLIMIPHQSIINQHTLSALLLRHRYQVALRNARGDDKLEPTAICNYATFTCRSRRAPERAYSMFVDGLAKFPHHKGLTKNLQILLKENPSVASPQALHRLTSEGEMNKLARVHTPSSKSKVRRALALANAGSAEKLVGEGTEAGMALSHDSTATTPAAVQLSPQNMGGRGGKYSVLSYFPPVFFCCWSIIYLARPLDLFLPACLPACIL